MTEPARLDALIAQRIRRAGDLAALDQANDAERGIFRLQPERREGVIQVSTTVPEENATETEESATTAFDEPTTTVADPNAGTVPTSTVLALPSGPALTFSPPTTTRRTATTSGRAATETSPVRAAASTRAPAITGAPATTTRATTATRVATTTRAPVGLAPTTTRAPRTTTTKRATTTTKRTTTNTTRRPTTTEAPTSIRLENRRQYLTNPNEGIPHEGTCESGKATGTGCLLEAADRGWFYPPGETVSFTVWWGDALETGEGCPRDYRYVWT